MTCIHFVICGGCSLQHLSEQEYRDFKLNLVRDKTKYQGDLPIHIIGPRQRQRAIFQVRSQNKQIELGFYEKKTHQLVGLKECLVLTPEIFAILAPLTECLSKISCLAHLEKLFVYNNPYGLDLVIYSSKANSLDDYNVLLEFAKTHSIARISWASAKQVKILFSFKPVGVQIAQFFVELAPASFLQASAQCQQIIAREIIEFAQHKKINRVIDLYAGCGSFSLIFDKKIATTAVEGSKDAYLSLLGAIKKYNLTHITAQNQDLYHYPVLAAQLQKFDLAIIDPPRNGATPQIKELVKSKIKNIVMVSCSLDSYCRDSRYLSEAGYKLDQLQIIDQFHWTEHVELLAFYSVS